MERMDEYLSFSLKREQTKFHMGNVDCNNISLEDINSLVSIAIPSLSTNKFPTDPSDEFLRLSTMVRAVYFSHLQKCLIDNYIVCYKEKHEEIPCDELKSCANHMELLAIRSSLETSVYRQNMLKFISDIKSHTSEKKAYKNLAIFLETPPRKVDVAVQTLNSSTELETAENVPSVSTTSNFDESFVTKETPEYKEENELIAENEDCTTFSELKNVHNDTASPTINSTNINDAEINKLKNESEGEKNDKMLVDDEDEMKEDNGTLLDNSNTRIAHQSIDENSQDSLLQHMEDMFCESDDSSDLTTLIERHSGVTKATVDKEINSLLPRDPVDSCCNVVENNSNTKVNPVKLNNVSVSSPRAGRYSFSYYKEMKNREAKKSLPVDRMAERQRRRSNSIWFVERVYQVAKLKAKMTELSLTDYRRHERVRERFIELFGESDEEEMMPDSPICIEEHLTACKERIAPWIVQHLMPFYKMQRIKDKQLFKIVAKHIANMLIIKDTFPEQECVRQYIQNYFKNKKFIRAKQDVYL